LSRIGGGRRTLFEAMLAEMAQSLRPAQDS
jgi:hypothetical protein